MSVGGGTLFDLPDEPCKYPDLGGTTGYRYGCRCPRCCDAKRQPMNVICRHPGCDALRQKGRGYCAEHAAPPKDVPRKRGLRIETTCAICTNPHNYYESMIKNTRPEVRDFYRQVCSPCRKQVSAQIRRYNLNTEQAFRLLRATHCDCCGEQFSRRWSKPLIEVDHNHDCCPGGTSCGRCIRGFTCPPCNKDIGKVEDMRKRKRMGMVFDYIERHAIDNSVISENGNVSTH